MAIKRSSKIDSAFSSSSSSEGDPSIITLSIVGDSSSPSGFQYVINRGEKYSDINEVESALRQHYAEYTDRPMEERPYISLRCDEKVTVDVLVDIIDLTREQKYKMVLATKNR